MEGEVQDSVIRAMKGDSRAWDELFKSYGTRLSRYCRGLVQHEDSALDLVQDSFESAYRNIATLKDPNQFGVWLFRIAYRKAVDQWRKVQKPTETLEGKPEPIAPDNGQEDQHPEEFMVRREEQAMLMEKVNSLPPTQRSVLGLFYMEGRSYREISDIMGCSPGTVRAHLYQARKTLQEKMRRLKP